MLQVNQGLFVGKDYEQGYVGYIAENNIYVVVSIEQGMTKEQGKILLDNLKEKLLQIDKVTLTALDAHVSEVLVKANVPLNFSMSLAYVYDNILYVKTIGDGAIYIRREKNFAQLISGDNRASGYIHEFDCFILTTGQMSQLLGSTEDIQKFIGYKKPKDIVDELYAQDYKEEDKGVIALFTEFVQEDVIEKTVEPSSTTQYAMEEPDMPEDSGPPPLQLEPEKKNKFAFLDQFKDKLSDLRGAASNKQKTITFIVVAVICAILVWSVVLGRQRQIDAQAQEKINHTTELVDQKLNEADEVAFLNVERAKNLISEAKEEVNKLKNEVGNTRKTDVEKLAQKINDKENSILKKEEKNFDEFFDLALEDKQANGDKFFLDGENVAVLDSKHGNVYVLSLSKKSVDTFSSTEADSASLVGLRDETVYFFKNSTGVFQFNDSKKTKKLIEKDKDWGKITDLQLYNGNLYMLDSGKDAIYKYLVTSNGFSDINEYFADGESVDLSSATSFAIDSSIYIALGDKIVKYALGARDTFRTTFPDTDVKIDKVYTNADLEQVYALDKHKGLLYILSKDGSYERQIQSSVFAKANDIVVFEKTVYILTGQKIYKVSL